MATRSRVQILRATRRALLATRVVALVLLLLCMVQLVELYGYISRYHITLGLLEIATASLSYCVDRQAELDAIRWWPQQPTPEVVQARGRRR